VADFSSDVFNAIRSGPTITTGVRGVDEEDFKEATPDVATLDIILLKQLDKNKIEKFAKQGNLFVKNIKIPTSDADKKENNND